MKSLYYKNKNQGFTLLFAALVVTILMSIGFTISNITLAQLILSSSGRESQFAFYNADSGLECALYYEYNGTSTTGGPVFPRNNSDDTTAVNNIKCNSVSSSNISIVSSGTSATTTFDINPADNNCNKTLPLVSFHVQVSKTATTTSGGFVGSSVYIQSRGYNTCDSASPKRVERGIYARFVD